MSWRALGLLPGLVLVVPGASSHAQTAARVGYRIDRGGGDNPARADTAEQILFAARFSLR